MGRIFDRSGDVVNGITFLEPSGKCKRGVRTMWLCKCHCGKEFRVVATSITSGNSKSCGCRSRANYKGINKGKKNAGYKHGETKTRLYGIWKDMRLRCNNENNQAYNYYGAKGIEVCEEWEGSYISFREWALSSGYEDNLTIDRIDVYGNYEPSNCKWSNRREQVQNRGTHKNSKSGVNGVTWNKVNKNWGSRITNNYKSIGLGSYENLEDAIEARRQGEIKYWGKEYQNFEDVL